MKIEWDSQAIQQLEQVFRLNQILFGTKKAKAIIQSIQHHIVLLKQFPQMGAIEQNTIQRSSPYRYLIEKHCKIFYTIESDTIFIALIWDTRQDPEKLWKYIK